MKMTPMAPKLPTPAAFGVLADLNEFLALPQKVRESTLTAYMTAAVERAAALEAITAQKVEQQALLDDAAQTVREAKGSALEIVADAEAESARLIADAKEQAKDIDAKARESVAQAEAKVKAAEADALTRGAGLDDRKIALDDREAELAEREQAAADLTAKAQGIKDEYDQRTRDLNSVMRRR